MGVVFWIASMIAAIAVWEYYGMGAAWLGWAEWKTWKVGGDQASGYWSAQFGPLMFDRLK